MSENIKEDQMIMRAVQKEKDCEAVYDSIKREEYTRLVNKAIADLRAKGMKGSDEEIMDRL